MISESERDIERHQLDNGTEMVFYDHSRRMSADRWIVELQCVAYIPIDDSYWNIAEQEDPKILAGIRKKIGDRLTHTFSNKRLFVPEEEREELLQEMVHQVYGC